MWMCNYFINKSVPLSRAAIITKWSRTSFGFMSSVSGAVFDVGFLRFSSLRSVSTCPFYFIEIQYSPFAVYVRVCVWVCVYVPRNTSTSSSSSSPTSEPILVFVRLPSMFCPFCIPFFLLQPMEKKNKTRSVRTKQPNQPTHQPTNQPREPHSFPPYRTNTLSINPISIDDIISS